MGMGALGPFGCKQSTLPDLLRLDSPDLAMRVHIRFYSPLLKQPQSLFQQPLAEREAVLPHGNIRARGQRRYSGSRSGSGCPAALYRMRIESVARSIVKVPGQDGLGETDGRNEP